MHRMTPNPDGDSAETMLRKLRAAQHHLDAAAAALRALSPVRQDYVGSVDHVTALVSRDMQDVDRTALQVALISCEIGAAMRRLAALPQAREVAE